MKEEVAIDVLPYYKPLRHRVYDDIKSCLIWSKDNAMGIILFIWFSYGLYKVS